MAQKVERWTINTLEPGYEGGRVQGPVAWRGFASRQWKEPEKDRER